MKHKIGICGTPELSINFFEAIRKSEKFEIAFTITQEAKMRDRGKKIQKTSVAIWSEKYQIPCYEICKIRDLEEKTREEIERNLKNIEAMILFAFGQIIPKKWLDFPKKGWLNIHPSKLPQLRGASPIQYTILNNYKQSALTLMIMDDKMDEGNLIAQKNFEVEKDDTSETLIKKINEFGPTWIVEKADEYLLGKIEATKQEGEATYSKLIKKEDSKITQESADEIINKIRAFGFVYLKFADPKIGEVKCFEASKNLIGALLVFEEKIAPIYIQVPGKKIVHVKDFMNGIKNK